MPIDTPARPQAEQFARFMQERRARVERAIERCLPAPQSHPRVLHQAMHYAVFGRGKRIRPLLVYASGSCLGARPALLDIPACSVELMHSYSLVHDDLPTMDDDDLRRGRPTCHRTFGEATALLAGDALQTLALYHLAHHQNLTVSDETRLKMIKTLTLASGSRGMAGGQAIDLESTGKTLNIAELEDMHIHKTGALIRSCVLLGALCSAGVDEGILERLDHYAKCVGLAFQIRDDILDVEGETSTLGKTRGKDKAQDKPTYPMLLGLKGAREKAQNLHRESLDSLEILGETAAPLRWISRYIVERRH